MLYPYPDPDDPKRPDLTGSGFYLDMFLMFGEINIFLWHFLTKSKHRMRLKIKDKKLFCQNCILYNFIKRENYNLFGDNTESHFYKLLAKKKM